MMLVLEMHIWVCLKRNICQLLTDVKFAVLIAGASLEAQIEQLARNPDVNMLYGMQV
jgi:hypothetical protein